MSKPREKALRRMLLCGAVSASFVLYAGTASADMAAAKKWVDEEFQPSTISKEASDEGNGVVYPRGRAL